MSGVFPKYIVEAGRVVMMSVAFHSQIVNNKNKVAGGGFFRFDPRSRAVIFYGESQEYGKASLQHMKESVWNGKVFMNPPKNHCIAGKYRFYYDTGTEIIELQKKATPSNRSVLAFVQHLAERIFYTREPFKGAY